MNTKVTFLAMASEETIDPLIPTGWKSEWVTAERTWDCYCCDRKITKGDLMFQVSRIDPQKHAEESGTTLAAAKRAKIFCTAVCHRRSQLNQRPFSSKKS